MGRFVPGEETGAVFDLPAEDFPLSLLGPFLIDGVINDFSRLMPVAVRPISGMAD